MPAGGFPGLMLNRRATIFAPKNPLDKATIVSIYGRELDEIKPTISPGRFRVPKGTKEHPSILVVGSSSWFKEVDEDQPFLEIPNGAIVVAESVIRDYCIGLLSCNMADAMPGLFWVPGEKTLLDITTKHKAELALAEKKQAQWYKNLVKMADVMWARTSGNPLCINDDMRMAAEALGLKEKAWMKDMTFMELVKCPACGTPRNGDFPVCPNCHAVTDQKKATELGIVFAKV